MPRNFGNRRKTNARKTIYNGHKYDSKLEACYAEFLDSLLRAKLIKSWAKQYSFFLPNLDGEFRLRYDADMIVTDLNGRDHIIEVKGRLTPDNVVKYSYFQFAYGEGYKIHLVSSPYDRKEKTYHFSKDSLVDCPWLRPSAEGISVLRNRP